MYKNNLRGYYFIAPFVIVFLVFNLYPILLTFYYSLTDYTGMGGVANAEFTWFKNYIRLFTDKYFYQSFLNTITIWGFNFAVQMLLALGLALIFSDLRLKMRGITVFRALFYLPNIITVASVALLFNILLDWNHVSLNHRFIFIIFLSSLKNAWYYRI